MRAQTIAPLAAALALVLAGCSQHSDEPGTRHRTAPQASPSPAATTTAAPSTDHTRFVCRTVDAAAFDQLLAASLAVAGDTKGPALRAGVAASYRDLADRLAQAAPLAPATLRSALTRWASTSIDVARFVTENQPRPGLVVDFGPAEPRWNAAREAAEKICGHPLPRLDD